MRDPKRIPQILAKLQKLWEKHPDLRLGQLVENLAPKGQADAYFVEDDILVQRINAILERGWS